MSGDFDDLIRKHVGAEKAEEQNSEEIKKYRVKWWQLRVEELLNQIDEWLKPLTSDGTVNFRRSPVQKREQWFGDYLTNAGLITLGNRNAKLDPVGTGIMGSFGRVNFEGPEASVYLILQANRSLPGEAFQLSDPVWYISKKEQQRRIRTQLTKSTFEELIKGIFGIE
jgi:hypothetical protein